MPGGAKHPQHLLENEQMPALRCALSKACHFERSEESALARVGPELHILRFAQDASRVGSFRSLLSLGIVFVCVSGMSAARAEPIG